MIILFFNMIILFLIILRILLYYFYVLTKLYPNVFYNWAYICENVIELHCTSKSSLFYYKRTIVCPFKLLRIDSQCIFLFRLPNIVLYVTINNINYFFIRTNIWRTSYSISIETGLYFAESKLYVNYVYVNNFQIYELQSIMFVSIFHVI